MKIQLSEGEELEVYKVQLALFGGPAALIYNQDGSELYETTDEEEVKEISKIIRNRIKAFAAGYWDDKQKIHLVKLLEGEWF